MRHFSLIGPKGASVFYCSNYLLKAISDAIKHLIHQLRILLVGDVGYDLLAGAGHPASLGVGGSAAGEYQDADIGPSHGVKIALESVSGPFVVQVAYVVLGGPILPIRIHIFPKEAAFAVGRVAEIKYLVTLLAELLYHLGLVGVSPAGGYVDFCHVGWFWGKGTQLAGIIQWV